MIQVHTYPYKTTQDRTRPYKQYTTIHDLTGPYMILQDRTGSYKSTRCPAKHVPILFLNFSASYLSRNSILNIFQQPCLCKFQKYPISYYLVKPGARYCQNTKDRSFQKLTFFHLLLNQELEQSCLIRTTQECSRVLKSTQEHSKVRYFGVMRLISANGTMLISAHECQ